MDAFHENHGHHAEEQGISQADPALYLEPPVGVIPPAGVKHGFQQEASYIFHNTGDQHTEAIQEQQIILKRFQQENDDYPAHSVNGADRPVQKAAVDESLGGDGTIYAFAEPSQKAVNKEQQKQ